MPPKASDTLGAQTWPPPIERQSIPLFLTMANSGVCYNPSNCQNCQNHSTMPVRAAMAGLAVQHGSLFRPERIRFAASLAYSQTQRASRPLNLGATRAKSRTGALVRRQRLEVSLKRFQLAAERGPVRLVWQAWGLNAEWFRTRAQAAQHHLRGACIAMAARASHQSYLQNVEMESVNLGSQPHGSALD